MKKVQSRMKLQNKILNSTLSFIGKAFRSFLNVGFKLIMFGKTKDGFKKSLLSPYFKAENHNDTLIRVKQKTLKTINFEGFHVHL